MVLVVRFMLKYLQRTYFITMIRITSISFSNAARTLGQLLASLFIRLYLNHRVPHGVHNYRWCLYCACNIISVSRMMFLSQVWESPVHRMTDVRVSNGGERKSLRLESSLHHIHHLRVIPRILRVLKYVQQLPFCLICIFWYLSVGANSDAGKNLHWFTIKSSLKSSVLDAVFFLAWKTWLFHFPF